MRGGPESAEDGGGLLRLFSFARRPGGLGGLVDGGRGDRSALKPYPGCAYLQAAVDAALAAEVSPAEVSEVQIAGGYLTAGMEKLGERAGLRPIGVTFSASLSVAVALIAGRLTHEQLSEEWLAENANSISELA